MKIRRIAKFIPLVLLVGAAVSSAQEEALSLCACKPREVGSSGSRKDWEGYRKGIAWHYEVDEAMKIAQAGKKLVFWYHVAGDLDKEGC